VYLLIHKESIDYVFYLPERSGCRRSAATENVDWTCEH